MLDWIGIKLGLVVVVGLVVYSNSLHGDFVFDDGFAILRNKDADPSATDLSSALTGDYWGERVFNKESHKSYRPLTVYTFRMNFFWNLSSPFQSQKAEYRFDPGENEIVVYLNSFGFHCVNLVIHLLNCLLLYRLYFSSFHYLISTKERVPETITKIIKWESVAVSLLFCVHPSHVEAVTGLVGRADLLALMLMFLCVEGYRYTLFSADSFVEQIAGAFFVFICSNGSVLCKEIGIMILPILVLYDFIFVLRPFAFLGKGNWSREDFKKVQWFVFRSLLLAANGIGYLKFRNWLIVDSLNVGFRFSENAIPFLDQPTRFLSTLNIHWWYFSLLSFPLRFCHDYSFEAVPLIKTIFDTELIFPLLLYISLFSLSLFGIYLELKQEERKVKEEEKREGERREGERREGEKGEEGEEKKERKKKGKKNRERKRVESDLSSCFQTFEGGQILWGIGWLVFPFLPSSNFLVYPGTTVGERLLYTPSVGYCLIVVALFIRPLRSLFLNSESLKGKSKQRKKSKTFFNEEKRNEMKAFFWILIFILYVIYFGALTYQRNADWEDEETLYFKSLENCPGSAKNQMSAASLYRKREQYQDAIHHYLTGFDIILPSGNSLCENWLFLGLTHLQSGNLTGALHYIENNGFQCERTTNLSVDVLLMIYGNQFEAAQNSFNTYKLAYWLARHRSEDRLTTSYNLAVKLIQEAPASLEAWNLLADIHERINKTEDFLSFITLKTYEMTADLGKAEVPSSVKLNLFNLRDGLNKIADRVRNHPYQHNDIRQLGVSPS